MLEVDAADADCQGGEGVFAPDGSPLGLVTSGGYGFYTQKSLAFAYVSESHSAPGTEMDVLILGEAQRATVRAEDAYDPTNSALRA